MSTFTLAYSGDLRVECLHTNSGATLITDAPKDNQGQGRAFSPSDLLAVALATCATTLMGIYAKNHGLDLSGMTAAVNKTMGANPRRVSGVEIVWNIPERGLDPERKKAVERAAMTCPVFQSVHPDLEKKITFNWLS